MNASPAGRRDALWVALLAAIVHAPGMFWGIPFGKAVNGGLRVLGGEVPYRDFWSMYAPGQFYAVAGVYRLFGREALAQAAVAVGLTAVAVGLFFSLCRRLDIERRACWTLAGLVTLFLWRTSPGLNHWTLALPLYLAGVERVAAYFETGGPRRLFVAGICFGLAAACKHDVAAYAAAGSISALVLAWWLAGKRRPAAWRPPWRMAALLVLGSACVGLPLAAALWRVAGADAWRDLIAFPATDFRSVRSEVYPGLLPDTGPLRAWLADRSRLDLARDALSSLSGWVYLNVPQLAFVLGLGGLLLARARCSPVGLARRLLCLCCLPWFWAAAHVQPNTHILSMALFTLALGGLAWTASSRPRPALALACAVYAGALCTHVGMELFLIATQWRQSRVLHLSGVRGIRVPVEEYDLYTGVARFVRGRTSSDEPIYVGVRRHDAVVIGNQRFYFLTGRRNATRYDEMHPAVVDRPAVQLEMIRDLERAGVRCVVRWNFGWPDRRLERIKARRREALPDCGAELLDRYIERHFEPVWRHGEYEILWRRSATVSRGG